MDVDCRRRHRRPSPKDLGENPFPGPGCFFPARGKGLTQSLWGWPENATAQPASAGSVSGAIGGRHLGCLVALRQLPWPTSPAVCEGTKVHAYADQQQSLQGSASFTPMLVQTERHPAGLAAPRAGHGSRQKRHEDTARWPPATNRSCQHACSDADCS